MKKIFTFISLVIFSSILIGQPTWIQINPGYGHNYRSIHFTDSLNGLACGLNGAIIKTTNGGLNWININSGVSSQFFDIKYLSPSIAIVIGSENLVLRSTNGGDNWTTVNPQGSQPYTVNAEIFSFQNGQTIIFSHLYTSPNDYKYLLKTSNYGANWQSTSINCYCRYMSFLNMNTGWANGQYNVSTNFYITSEKTTNGGTNWFVTYQFQTVSVNSDVIYFTSENTGYRFLNLVNILYKTNNSGSSWSVLMYTSPVDINSIYFTNSNTGWFAGSQGGIYQTLNAGTNWTQQTSPVNTTLYKIFFINEQIGWIAAGSSGILLNHLPSGILKITNEIPESFVLFQNYPNPFNPVTTIKFSTPLNPPFGKGGKVRSTGGFVTLKVYDILGREVVTLVNEELKPGTYEVEFDGSRFSSGVYYYKLIVDGSSSSSPRRFEETKMMVLMK